MTLLDPTYASRFVPIIASVSEHQPPQWSSYIMDLHVLVALAPAGGGPGVCVLASTCALALVCHGAMFLRVLVALARATRCTMSTGKDRDKGGGAGGEEPLSTLPPTGQPVLHTALAFAEWLLLPSPPRSPGILACFSRLTDASLFLVLYGLTAVYFSGVMVGGGRDLAVRCGGAGLALRVICGPAVRGCRAGACTRAGGRVHVGRRGGFATVLSRGSRVGSSTFL